eukprot:2549196-Alexandrium_andersonii.AAC.1
MRRSAAFIGMARAAVLQVLSGAEGRGCRCSGIPVVSERHLSCVLWPHSRARVMLALVFAACMA